MNAERLREPPGDIADQRETRLLLPRRGFLVFLVGSLLVTAQNPDRKELPE